LYGIMKSLRCIEPLEPHIAKSIDVWERNAQWIFATVWFGMSHCKEAVIANMTPSTFRVTLGSAVTVVGSL
jgi:hypothetical protein